MDPIEDYENIEPLRSEHVNADLLAVVRKADQRRLIIKRTHRPGVANREIQALQTLRHEHIIEFIIYFMDRQLRQCIVMERCQCDLQMLYTREPIPSVRLQKFVKQLCTGLEFVHAQGWMHRDIKPENLFIDKNDVLKIGDFGLARQTASSDQPSSTQMTPQVVTLWFRPIEIILGAPVHTTAIDMWAVGCVIAEIYRRWPLFQGSTEIGVLNKIIAVKGRPTVETWPTLDELPVMQNIELQGPLTGNLAGAMPHASSQALDFVDRLLTYDPAVRMTATQALAHCYFETDDSSQMKVTSAHPMFP